MTTNHVGGRLHLLRNELASKGLSLSTHFRALHQHTSTAEEISFYAKFASLVTYEKLKSGSMCCAALRNNASWTVSLKTIFVWILYMCDGVNTFHIGHNRNFEIAKTSSSGPFRSTIIPIARHPIAILHTSHEHESIHSNPNNILRLYATKIDVDPKADLVIDDLPSSQSETQSANTNKVLNALLLMACFGFVTYSVLNVDNGMTRGWTMGEKAMRIPLDNWSSYESSLNTQPIATKTMINVIIYLLGDWLSQTIFVNKSLLDFDAWRTTRNGFIGLVFGPLVHEYYEFSDSILPVEIGMNRFYKIIMDQTLYLSVKCSVYIVAVNMLAGESWEYSSGMAKDKIKGIMLTAWKFWPLVHCVTYGFIPARHRILWVNCVDLFWNAILALKTSAPEENTKDDYPPPGNIDDAETDECVNVSTQPFSFTSEDERKDPTTSLMTHSDSNEIIELVTSVTEDPERDSGSKKSVEVVE